ncbi:MAG: BON domain-containing protein [Pirellulales bacterium]|nr:BON domain-containing protein [Pirellulales bacterium]
MLDAPCLDERLDEIASRNPYLARRNLRIESQNGRVTLKGTVASYFHKQMAQEALRQVDGIGEIENQLEVEWV